MSDCILHQGYIMPNGYGQVRREGKTWLAHRWAARVAHGPARGRVVRHKCDNRACINPDHLEYGTQGDNLDDRKRHGHTYRKLNREQVDRILEKRRNGATLVSLATEFGVSAATISNISRGKQWAVR